jgi:hypothetical protein
MPARKKPQSKPKSVAKTHPARKSDLDSRREKQVRGLALLVRLGAPDPKRIDD